MVPEIMLVIASLFGINEEVKALIDNGGNARGISDISYSCIDAAQELLDIGEDLRRYDHYVGVYFGVLDRRLCFHSIRNAERPSLTEATVVLWAETSIPLVYLRAIVSTISPRRTAHKGVGRKQALTDELHFA